MFRDLRFALRNLNRRRRLSLVVVITLALGIGISSGVFAFLNAVILRPQLDRDFDSFVQVYSAYNWDPWRSAAPGNSTLEDFLAFSERAHTVRQLAAWSQLEAPLAPLRREAPFEVRALLVTPEFFSLYNLDRPLLGRLLQPDDFAVASPVIVLAETVWRNHFAADPGIVGKTISFNGQPVTVVGVAPSFAGMTNGARAWLPYTLETYLKSGDHLSRPGESPWLNIAGRLSPGSSRGDVATEFRLIAAQQDRLHPGRTSAITLTNGSLIQTPLEGRRISLAFYVVVVALLTLVLIVSLNVTTLLLSRATARRQEIAVRLALGASSMRLVRMLLTETFLLAAVAGVAGYYIAANLPAALDRWFTDRRFENAGTFFSLAPDWRVFAYLGLATLLAAVMVGLTPALQSLKVNLSEMLKGRQSLPAGVRSGRLFGLLTGTQVALSFFLLYGAVICIGAARRAAAFEPGFETRQVLLMNLTGRSGWGGERDFDVFHRRLNERLSALPGVQTVAYTETYPFGYSWGTDVQRPGGPVRGVSVSGVSPNYFSTLGIPILSGRALQAGDPPCQARGACPVVVSQQFAREFWPGESPLGKILKGNSDNSFEVVGVARDIAMTKLGAVDDPLLYEPLKSVTENSPYTPLVRFDGDPARVAQAMTAAVKEIAPEIVVNEPRTIQSLRDQSMDMLWRLTGLVSLICGLAVFLALIGVYGVVSFAVSQRTRELGIRIALGAQTRDVYRTILGSRGRPVLIGLMAGLILSLGTLWALTPVLKTAPFAMSVWDPIGYGITAVLLAGVTLLAMLLPARRGATVNPLDALRYE